MLWKIDYLKSMWATFYSGEKRTVEFVLHPGREIVPNAHQLTAYRAATPGCSLPSNMLYAGANSNFVCLCSSIENPCGALTGTHHRWVFKIKVHINKKVGAKFRCFISLHYDVSSISTQERWPNLCQRKLHWLDLPSSKLRSGGISFALPFFTI